MQHTRYVQQISAAEWRWVLLCAVGMVLVALLPFAVLPASLDAPDVAFMGVTHDVQATAGVLASTQAGARGQWLWRALHTPEPQKGVITDTIYILLGQAARFVRIEPLVLFHVARALAILFMAHALYALGASIWSRVNSRRMFWVIASLGAGIGWLVTPLLPQAPPDIAVSVIFPFHGALSNVHLPLAVGSLSFLVAAMLDSLRVDADPTPSVINSGIGLIVFSLLLGLIYPPAIGPVGVAYAIALLRSIPTGQWRGRMLWFAWFFIPALLLPAYHVAVILLNPLAMQLWELEARSEAPSLLLLVVGLGLPLVVALPGIWRAIRRFEQDGSAFMLTWLLVMIVMAYVLPIVRGKFLLALMLPVAYFATRAVGDFWLPRIRRPEVRFGLAVLAIPLMIGSQAVTLFAPFTAPTETLTLPRDYTRAFNFLQVRPAGVILASGHAGLWLPAWSGQQVVYASPELTLGAAEKSDAVNGWFTAQGAEGCGPEGNHWPSLAEPYRIRYVIYGPLERAIGAGGCLADMIELAQFDSVTVYRVAP